MAARLLYLVWSTAAVVAGAINAYLRAGPVPKVGMSVRIIADEAKYQHELLHSGLGMMIEAGLKGTIRELDMAEGQCLFHPDGRPRDEVGWIPLRALIEFQQWCPAKGCPPPMTTQAPVVAPAAAAPAPAAATTAAPPAAVAAAPATQPPTRPPRQRMSGKTDYFFDSCRRLKGKVEDAYVSPLGMNLNLCFMHCHLKPGMHHFAISQTSCYCTSLPTGEEVSGDNCDQKCAGNPTEDCGGAGFAASVYKMIDCDPPTPDEKIQIGADHDAKLLAAYSRFNGQSCGQDKNNLVKVGGSTTMTGTSSDCSLACWNKKGGEGCQGFTYESGQSKCTFYGDVHGGKVIRKNTMTCYFKKVGFKVKDGLDWD